jgi:cellulose biosynthesis protein BcsQ
MTIILGPQPETQDVINWPQVLSDIPDNAHEAIISTRFAPLLLKALGFRENDIFPEFKTGKGSDSVDFAARYERQEASFTSAPENPHLLLELKGRSTISGSRINLGESSPQYISTKLQLDRYLLAPKCESVQWGIITNANHIQLFRRHGRVIVPATPNQVITPNNIEAIISYIKKCITSPHKSLNVCVYNNKGGVGKTTTVLNLSAILRKQGKKILIVDFDSQADVTRSLKVNPGNVTLSQCLVDPSLDPRDAVVPFKHPDKTGKIYPIFDVIPADLGLKEFNRDDMVAKIQKRAARLRDILKPFHSEYDYIIIDCPTQWLFFSQSGVYASDVVLIPAQHNGFASLHHAAEVITTCIPEIKGNRKDGGPIALPIFFNNEKITDYQLHMANEEIKSILHKDKSITQYFWPKNLQKGLDDKRIFTIPKYARVASAAFSSLPAVFTNSVVHKHYLDFAKEYFLYG